jgi:ABC-type transporter Mla subunit MlaD
MAKQRNAVRAGIFMIVSVALVIMVIIAISGAGRFTQSFKAYPIAFSLTDDVGGLRVGDDVRLGGVKVGSVGEIEIRKLPEGQAGDLSKENVAVVVTIDVPEKYPVAKNAMVGVQKGLTGAATINIVDLGNGDQLASGAYLRGTPDALSALMRRLGTASEKLNTDLDKIGQTADSFTATGFTATATIGDFHVRLPGILARYDDLVASAIRALDAIRDFVGPGSGDFRTTLANFSRMTTDLRERLPDLLDQMRGILRKTDISVTRVNSALADVQTAMANLRDMSAGLRAVVVDNRGKLDGIIASMKATGDNLQFATMEIRHSPWRVLYQPKPGEVTNLTTYNSVRQFAEGANSLDDAAAALRDALKDKNADPEQVKKLMARLDISFEKFQAVQDKLWKDIQ